MLRLSTILLLSLAWPGLAPAAAAQTVTYSCLFNPSADGWLQTPVTVTFDTAGQRAAVQDPIVRENVGAPVEARYRQRRNGKLEASWDLGNIRLSRGARRVSWTIQVDPSDKSGFFKAHWQMVGEDAQRPPSARGQCEQITGADLLP